MAEIRRPGVADTDPPNEVDDGEAPSDGLIDPPNANPGIEEIRKSHAQTTEQAQADHEEEPPYFGYGGFSSGHDVRDFFTQRVEIVAAADDPFGVRRVLSGGTIHCRTHAGYAPSGILGFGLRIAAR